MNNRPSHRDLVTASPSARILVTGAGGFVGTHLCRSLWSAGKEAYGLARKLPRVEGWRDDRTIIGDLFDGDALSNAVSGVRAIVHLAGRAHILREQSLNPLDDFRRANVTATELLLNEAIKADVEHFVLMSSVAAVTSLSDSALTERTQEMPDTAYGLSKLEAERLVRQRCSQAGMTFTLLRPPMVYGARMKGNPLRLFNLIAAGMPLPLRGISNLRSSVYVENLVVAIIAVLQSPAARNELFLVGDSEPVSSSEFARRVATALGKPSRQVIVPLSLLQLLGNVGDEVRPVIPFPIDSTAVSRFTGSLKVDWSKLEEMTGYCPQKEMNEGLSITAEWYLSASRKGG